MNKRILLTLMVLFFAQTYATEQNKTYSTENMQYPLENIFFKVTMFSWIIIVVGIVVGFFIGRAHVLYKARREITDVLNNRIRRENIGYSFSKRVYEIMNRKVHTNNDLKSKEMQSFEVNKYNLELLEDNIKKHRKEILDLMDRVKKLEVTNRELLERLLHYEPDYKSEKIKESYPTAVKNVSVEKGGVQNDAANRNEEQTKPYVTKYTKHQYFSMPESDGSFKLSNGKPSNDGKSNFQIEFEESSKHGELTFISSDRDQRAINRLESFLKPVCEIENISSVATSSKIHVIEKGRVRLVNDSWVIDPRNKIKIKLY